MFLNICSLPDIIKVMKIIGIVITIIKIAVPIILIISAMLDLLKAVSDAELNKITKPMVNKIIAAILVFMIPGLVKLIARVTLTPANYESCFSAYVINENKEKAII